VLLALDAAAEPMPMSRLMAAAVLVLYQASKTVEHLVSLGLVRAVPPGARYELTEAGRARVMVLHPVPSDRRNRPGEAQQ
jgi:predicted transcriptional regulator